MEIRNFRPQKITRLHGFRSTRLPRGRDCVGGVLPAVVADTAKAEGVAFHTAEILPVAGVLLRTSVPRGLAATQRLRCRRGQLPQALHAVTASTAASSLAREPWGRVAGIVCEDKNFRPRKFPDYMSLSIHGSLAAAASLKEQSSAAVTKVLPHPAQSFYPFHNLYPYTTDIDYYNIFFP